MTDPNATTTPEDKAPAKNASRDEWVEYALAHGKTEADLDGQKRDDIAGMFADDSGDGNKPTGEQAKKTAYEAGEAMTAPGANPLVKAGAETLPPHLRAAAVHRAIE